MQNRTALMLLTSLIVTVSLSAGFDDTESWKIYDDSEPAEIRITVDPADLQWIYANVESDLYFPAEITYTNAYIDTAVSEVGFRLRGNTSRTSAKKSFKLSFNEYVPGREFYDVDKLNLNGEHNDPSIYRSKLSWDIFNTAGIISSRAAHALVYINDEFYGVYVNVEHVDDEFLKTRFGNDDGNLWKCLWPANLAWVGDDPSEYWPENYPDGNLTDTRPYELKTNEDEYDFSALARFIRVINTVPDEEFADSINAVLDVREFLQYLAINVLTGSWDDYRYLMNNYYLYHDPVRDIIHWIPYDYDNTLGIDFFGIDWAMIDPFSYAVIDDRGRPLSEKILAVPEFRNLFTHFLEFYASELVTAEFWEDDIVRIKRTISPYAMLDTYRSMDYGFSYDDFNNSYFESEYSVGPAKYSITEFMNVRNSSLEQQVEYIPSGPSVYFTDRSIPVPGEQEEVKVYASVFAPQGISSVTLMVYTSEFSPALTVPMTSDPGPDAGERAEDADRWSCSYTVDTGSFNSVMLVVRAEDNAGNTAFSRPETMNISRTSNISVKLNELMADNATAVQDDAGDYDDWLELYNTGNETVDLSGFFLTDDELEPEKWQFPQGIILGAGSFLMIWCDEDEGAGLHTNFKLSAGGEYLALVDRDGAGIIDSLHFPAQSEDISWGRVPDGAGEWGALVSFSPGAPNENPNGTVEIPGEFVLSPNYPNPFNGTTAFRYYLPERSDVSGELLDISGRRVKLLINRNLEAGEYSISLNSHDIPSGVYLLRLSASDQVLVRKCAVLK